MTAPPVVLIVAGNDPSGGAGVTADTQAVSALGGHPAPVITALTVQDTRNASHVEPTDPGLVVRQMAAVMDDLPVAAVKIGLLATAATGRAVADALDARPSVPVVLDPVLVAAGGARLAEDALVEVLLDRLLPRSLLVTPNAAEIRRLAPEAGDRDARARTLLATGCPWVLVKGGDEPTVDVRNTLYGPDGFQETQAWPRLPHEYHGSGCTLAAACAALLARGDAVDRAVADAERYTWAALDAGYRPSGGQYVPRRQIDLPPS